MKEKKKERKKERKKEKKKEWDEWNTIIRSPTR